MSKDFLLTLESSPLTEEQYLQAKEFIGTKQTDSKKMKRYSTAAASILQIALDTMQEFEFRKMKLAEITELDSKMKKLSQKRNTAIALIKKNQWIIQMNSEYFFETNSVLCVLLWERLGGVLVVIRWLIMALALKFLKMKLKDVLIIGKTDSLTHSQAPRDPASPLFSVVSWVSARLSLSDIGGVIKTKSVRGSDFLREERMKWSGRSGRASRCRSRSQVRWLELSGPTTWASLASFWWRLISRIATALSRDWFNFSAHSSRLQSPPSEWLLSSRKRRREVED